jgi:predicted aldo/keto reductase-like oxidoreductase
MEAFPVKRSLAEWGLAWLWDQPEVSVVLSGMTTMQQVQENLQYADRSRVHSFTDAEQQLLAQVREMYSTRSVIPCNRCGYCMPCPNGVNIPANLDLYNYAHLFDDLAGARFKYQFYLNLDQRSGCCIECHECEAQCPQKIAISELMPKVSALLA